MTTNNILTVPTILMTLAEIADTPRDPPGPNTRALIRVDFDVLDIEAIGDFIAALKAASAKDQTITVAVPRDHEMPQYVGMYREPIEGKKP